MERTRHFNNDNLNRKELIKNTIGLGKEIKTFYWDKGHPNGAEFHTITDTGIIIISNVRTKKLITMLIARPQQIRRYYEANGQKAPQFLVEIARQHQELGYNEF